MGGAGFVGIILLVVGGLLLAGHLIGAARTRRFLRNGADAQGVVVDLNRYVTRGSDGRSARSVQPGVAFDLPDGRQVTFEDALGTSWEPYELGAVVPVKYDPGDPEDARIELGPKGTRPDGNAIDLDQELVTAHRNASAFIDQANVLARLSTLIRTAIG